MEEIWIIGVGQFGTLAYRRLSERRKKRRFVLVDPNKENLLRCEGPHAILEESDGVDYLTRHLDDKGRKPDWIIPALPVHLAAEWILSRLASEGVRRIPIPPEIEPLLPNPMRGSEGNIYVSHADFRCPDDCAEPRDLCTVTQKPRKQDMFDLLGELRINPFQSMVIRSYQLGPGIGGYRPKQLFALLEGVEQASGSVLVSTACRCHGVITALERR
ncbi:MAG: potassium transporter [Deltaproteobacteria bacterium]|nr:potassium transporter [Deltaproteobacteria bacterium]